MSDHNWALLALPGVMEVIEQAATKVARHYEVDADDLVQEASILVTNLDTDLPETIGPDGLGLLAYRLEKDLVNLVTKQIRHRGDHESYEERYDDSWSEDGYGERAKVDIRKDTSTYTRELVESLIPAVWDEAYCYGMLVENAPDPDMPRGSTNKATGNTLSAHIADIKAGWANAPLNLDERQAVFLVLGQDLTQDDAAVALGVSQQTVSRRLYSGVGKIVATLNGDAALLEQVAEVELVAA